MLDFYFLLVIPFAHVVAMYLIYRETGNTGENPLTL